MSLSTSAYALDQAFNERMQTIAHNPTTNAVSCINRHIYLSAHTYQWYLITDNGFANSRNITLATGWYQWTDCIAYEAPHVYEHDSDLDPDASGYATASLEELEYPPADNGSTTAYWGSTLIP